MLVLVPLAGKFVGAFVGTYVTQIDAPFALAAGLMSKGVAEIAFLLVMLESGAIEKDVFSLLVLMMSGYILFMPAVINFGERQACGADAGVPGSQPGCGAGQGLQQARDHAHGHREKHGYDDHCCGPETHRGRGVGGVGIGVTGVAEVHGHHHPQVGESCDHGADHGHHGQPV